MTHIENLPEAINQLITGYNFTKNTIGFSRSQVFQLTHLTKPTLYLKIQCTSSGNLYPEKARLDWLRNQLPVPKLMEFAEENGVQYMLITEIPGVPSFDDSLRMNWKRLIGEFAEGLRRFHTLKIADCPFRYPLQKQVERIQGRFIRGELDSQAALQHFNTPDVEELHEKMINMLPETEDLVVCHGDYSMPNVIFQNGKVSGFIDLGQLTVADRYIDLVAVHNTFQYNKLPSEAFAHFLGAYGLTELNEDKMMFYAFLNRFLD